MSLAHSTNTPFHFDHRFGPRAETLEERFWSKVNKTPGCWLWEGCIDHAHNYGVFKVHNEKMPAHRAAWLLTHGSLSAELHIVHTCNNSLCVRPDHLIQSTAAGKFWLKVRKTETCWLWEAGGGLYGRFRFRGKTDCAHRVAWILCRGEIPDGLYVLHHCDVRRCVNPDHLFLGTYQDNVDDMVAKGRHVHGDEQWTRKHPERVVRGDRHGSSKLTAEQVIEMRTLFAAGGVSKLALARRFGVAHCTVRRVIARTIWAHV